MRFAFVSTMHSAIWGGSEELWSQAARQLRREGHDVLASVVFWMRQSDRLKRLSQEGIQVEGHSLDEAGRVRRWREKLLYGGPKAYRDLKQFDPDLVVISQGSNSGGFDWARICRERKFLMSSSSNAITSIGGLGSSSVKPMPAIPPLAGSSASPEAISTCFARSSEVRCQMARLCGIPTTSQAIGLRPGLMRAAPVDWHV